MLVFFSRDIYKKRGELKKNMKWYHFYRVVFRVEEQLVAPQQGCSGIIPLCEKSIPVLLKKSSHNLDMC